MAREKGTGNLQREKSGRWTLRVCFKGKRYSRSTGTTDRDKAERYLERFLSPLGLGRNRLPLSEVWREYLVSPNIRDLAQSTLDTKRLIWLDFARWMEQSHLEVDSLDGITHEAVAGYLACIRADVCASTYNARVCVLREIFRCLASRARLVDDPWEGVRLLEDDSHSRREFSMPELLRIFKAAAKKGDEWWLMFEIGAYTGLRLCDCCCLRWNEIDMARGVIQVVLRKTRRHSRGRAVTIPIHPALAVALGSIAPERRGSFILETLSSLYMASRGRLSYGLRQIFRAAGITTSIRICGRRRKTPEATFHSLRHTFVSFAANAGVSLPVIASIVGHESTAMTRHYYHESEEALRRAIAAIPAIGVRRDLCR